MNDIKGNDQATGIADPAAPAADELTALRGEIAELKNQHLRAVADARNIQQRATREKQEAIQYAEADFARELLSVLDDLTRTLDSAQSGADAARLTEGVRITLEHFRKVLAARGIQPIEAAGRPFDPARHEALMQQPSGEHPAGTVISEVAGGYTMHGRVLRPTRVIVSSGKADTK